MEQRSLFGLSEHLERISKIGDPLERDVFTRKHNQRWRDILSTPAA
jgi:hypothetical protein